MFLLRSSRNLLAFYHECHSLIGYVIGSLWAVKQCALIYMYTKTIRLFVSDTNLKLIMQLFNRNIIGKPISMCFFGLFSEKADFAHIQDSAMIYT